MDSHILRHTRKIVEMKLQNFNVLSLKVLLQRITNKVRVSNARICWYLEVSVFGLNTLRYFANPEIVHQSRTRSTTFAFLQLPENSSQHENYRQTYILVQLNVGGIVVDGEVQRRNQFIRRVQAFVIVIGQCIQVVYIS